jgi:hypothetical protein
MSAAQHAEIKPGILRTHLARCGAPRVFVCGQLIAGLNSGMKRPTHKFKVGQQVYHHSAGGPPVQRTGPYTVIGVVWQPSGTMVYRIKSETREQLAHESELKLALKRD